MGVDEAGQETGSGQIDLLRSGCGRADRGGFAHGHDPVPIAIASASARGASRRIVRIGPPANKRMAPFTVRNRWTGRKETLGSSRAERS